MTGRERLDILWAQLLGEEAHVDCRCMLPGGAYDASDGGEYDCGSCGGTGLLDAPRLVPDRLEQELLALEAFMAGGLDP